MFVFFFFPEVYINIWFQLYVYYGNQHKINYASDEIGQQSSQAAKNTDIKYTGSILVARLHSFRENLHHRSSEVTKNSGS